MTGDQQAACAGHPEPLWDGAVDGETPVDQDRRHARALAICRSCPVRRACAELIDVQQDDGVRAGVLLPTIRDSHRGSYLSYRPNRGGLAAVLG